MTSNHDRTVLVAGGGGFIGGALAKKLMQQGYRVRCADIKPFSEWYQFHEGAENMQLDLREKERAFRATEGCREVFNFAADMGGMGFIERNKALCMLSVLINTHLLEASRELNVDRYFYASSACVYNGDKQKDADSSSLRESDAYPAMPEDGYGWEKLFSERMCRHFREDFGLETRVARFHNIYGPHGTWDGGREKAPAALCRKVIEAQMNGTGEIEIWGDGEQTRSFAYIDDCVKGILMIMRSDYVEPINLGSDEMVTINQLADYAQEIAGVKVERNYNLDAPKGVRGRNSDNTEMLAQFGWAPDTTLRAGLEKTYAWILQEMQNSIDAPLPNSFTDDSCGAFSSSTSATGQTTQVQDSI